MIEKPMLFSGPMVKALLEDRKTQTRRVLNPKHYSVCVYPNGSLLVNGGWLPSLAAPHPVGSRIWVRETWAPCLEKENHQHAKLGYTYRADWSIDDDMDCRDFKWKPSIHMPRWASRITLEVVNVRVERLNDISDFDAFQEGAKDDPGTITGPYCRSFIQGYKNLWESINGKGSWELNPLVWVYDFRRVKP